MKLTSLLLALPLLLLTGTGPAGASSKHYFDSLSLTLGTDEDSLDSDVYRLGLQKKWRSTWFNSGAWYVGGYWDTELAYISADDASGDENDDLFDLSLTPVFRLQRDTALSSGVSPFAEAGIGTHLLSETRLADQKFSTLFQFGSLIGLGVGFGKHGQYELSYRFQHISNADIKTPNDGLNLHLLRLGYAFE